MLRLRPHLECQPWRQRQEAPGTLVTEDALITAQIQAGFQEHRERYRFRLSKGSAVRPPPCSPPRQQQAPDPMAIGMVEAVLEPAPVDLTTDQTEHQAFAGGRVIPMPRIGNKRPDQARQRPAPPGPTCWLLLTSARSEQTRRRSKETSAGPACQRLA